MEFRKWLAEWEGFSFPGDDSQYYNSPDYPNSRYKGPGRKEPGNIKKVEKMYKFKPTGSCKSSSKN